MLAVEARSRQPDSRWLAMRFIGFSPWRIGGARETEQRNAASIQESEAIQRTARLAAA
jgi:hypothetical protein